MVAARVQVATPGSVAALFGDVLVHLNLL